MKRRLAILAAMAAVGAAAAFTITAASADVPDAPPGVEVTLPPGCAVDELEPGESIACGFGPEVGIAYDEGQD